jgi:outer membrane protein TolC
MTTSLRTFTCLITAVVSTISSIGLAGQPPVSGDSLPLILTLDRAISLALQQNRDVMIADQERVKADAQVTEAWAGALPTLTFTGTYTRNIKLPVLFLPPNTAFNPTTQTQTLELGSNNAYVGGVSINQTLFNWKVGQALDIAHLYHDYSLESSRSVKGDVIFAVKRAFYAVLFSRKLVEANRKGLDIVRANLDNVRSQFRNGTAAEFDQLRAEVQVANTEPLVTSAENGYLLSMNSLKSVLALPLETQIDVRGDLAYDTLSTAQLDSARHQAVLLNPAIQSLSLQESMLEKNIGVERAGHFPVLSLTGAYNLQAQDNTFKFNDYLWAKSFYLGLNLSVPIFDGFRTSARTEQASIDKEKVHIARLKAQELLLIQIQSAELTMQEALKRIEGQRRSIEQARKAVSIAQTRYKSGVGTQLELLDAQVAMTRTETNYVQAIYDYLVARAGWNNAIGTAE